MKKIVSIMALFILLLAACNSPQETSPAEVEEPETEEQTEEEPEEDVEVEPEVEEGEEPVQEEVGSSAQQKNEEVTTPDESVEKGESDNHQELVDVTKKIFAAQNNKDYDFLQSILSKGSKLDKKNNKFIFENVTYPHEQEFLTEKNAGDLEHRYTHENNADSVIVGFAAIDYENEYSFVIDFEFIREDGKWKMNDMDINK